ncbi:MAG: hypothetical protein RJA36_2127 [Pseudomonadota bacterium]
MIDTESSSAWASQPELPRLLGSWTWFKQASSESLLRIARRYGLKIEVNVTDLGQAFFRWCGMLDGTIAYQQANPVEYAYFSSRALLECLFRSNPIQAMAAAEGAPEPEDIARLLEWPTGFTATSLAFTVLDAQLRHLGLAPLTPDYDAMRLHWNSFRENVSDDIESIEIFFNLFCGVAPA